MYQTMKIPSKCLLSAVKWGASVYLMEPGQVMLPPGHPLSLLSGNKIKSCVSFLLSSSDNKCLLVKPGEPPAETPENPRGWEEAGIGSRGGAGPRGPRWARV